MFQGFLEHYSQVGLAGGALGGECNEHGSPPSSKCNKHGSPPYSFWLEPDGFLLRDWLMPQLLP